MCAETAFLIATQVGLAKYLLLSEFLKRSSYSRSKQEPLLHLNNNFLCKFLLNLNFVYLAI